MKPFDYQKYLKNNPLLKEGHEAEIGFGPAHQKPDIEEAGGFTAESDMSIDGVDPRAFDLDHTIYTDDQGRVDMNNGWPRLYRAFKSKNMKDFNYMADQLYSALEDDPYTQEEFGKFVKRIIAKLGGGYSRFDATNVDAEEMDEFNESEASQEKVTEGNRPWDFNVYDMDAMQMAQFKKAAERLGFKARLDEVGIGMVEIRLWPSNDKTFKQAFKILEKMGLEFDESHGMF